MENGRGLALEKYLNVRDTFTRVWSGRNKEGNFCERSHMYRCESLLAKYGLDNVVLDDRKDICLRRTYEVILSPSPIKEKGIIIYTDGSKSEEGTGYGFLCEDDGHEANGALRDEATVFQAEILALKKAAERLIRRELSGETITVYSDSKAGLMAMLSRKTSSKLVHETKVKWNHVGTKNEVELRWIKAHVGHEGNERADELAKEGHKCALNETYTPKSWVKRFLNGKLREKWAKQWLATKSYRHTKMWIPNIDLPQVKGLLQINNRKTVGLIAQWITSFNNLNYHTHRKNHKKYPGVNKACRLCQKKHTEETSWHLATECDRTANAARLHLHKFTQDHKSWTWESLKAFITSPMIFKLVSTREKLPGE